MKISLDGLRSESVESFLGRDTLFVKPEIWIGSPAYSGGLPVPIRRTQPRPNARLPEQVERKVTMKFNYFYSAQLSSSKHKTNYFCTLYKAKSQV